MHIFQVMMTGSQGFLVWFDSGLFVSNTNYFLLQLATAIHM